MKSYKKLKLACYSASVCMSIISNMTPLLFVSFMELYGISYSLLGLLILINFSTQLLVDLIFSFFAHKFNIQATVRVMPILTLIGLLILGLSLSYIPIKRIAFSLLTSVLSGQIIGLIQKIKKTS
jgi:hypothetical protein